MLAWRDPLFCFVILTLNYNESKLFFNRYNWQYNWFSSGVLLTPAILHHDRQLLRLINSLKFLTIIVVKSLMNPSSHVLLLKNLISHDRTHVLSGSYYQQSKQEIIISESRVDLLLGATANRVASSIRGVPCASLTLFEWHPMRTVAADSLCNFPLLITIITSSWTRTLWTSCSGNLWLLSSRAELHSPFIYFPLNFFSSPESTPSYLFLDNVH